MIDFDPEIEDDPEVLEGMLNNSSSGYVEYTRIEFYDKNWNNYNIEFKK